MFFSQIMAKAANARIPASTRALLASHADCVLVVDTNFYRAAFRITTDGRLIAVSSLADGDVHIGLDDKGFQARGNAALLRDLGEVWKELRGSLEEWLSIVFGRSMGMQAAEYIRLAADDAKRRWHDSFAPTQSEVDGFNRQTRDLQRKIDELTARVARLTHEQKTSH